jgi:peroxiredoxin
LTFGDLAPDAELPAAGAPGTTPELVRLATLWAERPLLLAFLRQFGCTECRALVAQLHEAQTQLAEAGLKVALVTQGTPEATAAFAAEQKAAELLWLADPERRVYAAYGLERGTLYQTVLSPRVWQGLARARQRGIEPRRPTPGQDIRQMSGTFIIGPDGRVRLPYYYDHIADHPPLALLLRGVLSTGWEQPIDGPLGS